MTIPPDAAQWVRDEKRDLDERLAKLDAFLRSSEYGALELRDRVLLCYQREAMKTCSNILTARIERF